MWPAHRVVFRSLLTPPWAAKEKKGGERGAVRTAFAGAHKTPAFLPAQCDAYREPRVRSEVVEVTAERNVGQPRGTSLSADGGDEGTYTVRRLCPTKTARPDDMSSAWESHCEGALRDWQLRAEAALVWQWLYGDSASP